MSSPIIQFEKLSRVCDIIPGFAFKSELFTQNANDIALVKGENLQQGFIDWGMSKHWPRGRDEGLSKYKLQVGDIVLAMDRPWVTGGLKWAYIKPEDPESLLVQRVAKLRAKPGLEQNYLRALISSKAFTGYIQPIVTGVNVPHISAKQIGDFVLPLPKECIQKKIAAVLTAYDDLIENNKRRIALLEKMAEEIYREWFVRMRFPGHQNAKFIKGIPEGWSIEKLTTVAQITYGYPFDSDLFNTVGSGLPIVRIRNIRDAVSLDFTTERVDEKYKVTDGDFLVGMDGEFHMNHWCGGQALLVHRSCRVKAKRELLNAYISLALRAPIKHLEATVVGATVAHLGAMHLNQIDIVVPHESLGAGLRMLNNALNQKLQLGISNRILRNAREMLLNRLLSGKTPIGDLEILLPPSMAQDETKLLNFD